VLKGRELIVTFQSRFGKAKWLEPYTDVTLEQLPGARHQEAGGGRARLLGRLPGDAGGAGDPRQESFIEAGGERFAYLACLNDSPGGIAMLRSIVGTELEGWVSHQ
jgi:ferrochelatase